MDLRIRRRCGRRFGLRSRCYRRRSCLEEMVGVATRVLIAGGGVAALEAALALRALAEDRVSVELLAPEPSCWYRPLAVAEPFGLGEARQFGLAELAAAAGAIFSPGALVRLDAGRRVAWTSTGGSIPYDVLLVACGAVPTPAVAGALTFRGPADTERMRRLLEEIAAARVGRVAFVVPWGAVWSLPIYELVLMTAGYLAARGVDSVDLALVTPEEEPLQLFGRAGSEAVRELLEERGVAVRTGSCAVEFVGGELRLVPEGSIAADRVVALPRLRGPRIDGLPQTVEGFLPVDAHGQVHGLSDVFAGVESPPEAPAAPGAVSVEVELDAASAHDVAALRLELAPDAEGEDGPTVADAMSTDPLVVAPEDTLGEVAERMRARDLGSALVADYGRLIGMITSRDLLRAFASRVHPSEGRVREWMTAEPVATSAATPIEAAVTLMTQYGLHHLPVVEDERPTGLLGLRQAAREARARTGIGLGFWPRATPVGERVHAMRVPYARRRVAGRCC